MLKFKETIRGTYAGVYFTPETLDRIEALQKKLDLPDPTPREKLHTTILYSRVWVPFSPEQSELKLCDSGYLDVLKHNGKRALVLVLDSDYLHFRHNVGMALGATYDFPSYIPHITLSYDIKSLSFEKERIDLEVIRSKEYVEELDLDWNP